MRTGAGFARFAGIMVLCLGMISAAGAVNGQKKTKKPPLPPLPSGPTGPVPQIPLDSMAPVSPQVTYQSGQLTIVAPNSTLGDILRAVRKQFVPPESRRAKHHHNYPLTSAADHLEAFAAAARRPDVPSPSGLRRRREIPG